MQPARLKRIGRHRNHPRRVEINVLLKKLKDARQTVEEGDAGNVSKYGDA